MGSPTLHTLSGLVPFTAGIQKTQRMLAALAWLAAVGSPGRSLLPLAPDGDSCGLEDCTECCWPSVYLLGAQKAATTALSWALQESLCFSNWRPDEGSDNLVEPPAVSFQPSNRSDGSKPSPEVHAFDGDMSRTVWVRERPSRYAKLFRPLDCPPRRFMDGSPVLHHWTALLNLRALVPPLHVPKMRLVVVLREPISRDLSEFNHHLDQAGSRTHTHMMSLCSSNYTEYVACEMEKWQNCIDGKMTNPDGTAQKNGAVAGEVSTLKPGTYEQYTACPGWDRVMMDSALVRDAEAAVRRATKRYPRRESPQTDLQLLAAEDPEHGGRVLNLAKGMYSAQIRHVKEMFERSQLLVLSFENATGLVATWFSRLCDFAGVPTPRSIGDTLTPRNTHESKTKLRTIPCETRRQLEAFYAPWNAALYAELRRDRDQQKAPWQEMPFPEFQESVPCTD